MTTKYLKIDWLIPLLGVAVIAAGMVAATTYVNLERKIQADQAFMATLDRMLQDQQISSVLRTMHDGQADQALQRLDLILCADILRTNSELASADARTRQCIEDAFRRLAHTRPKIQEGATAASTGGSFEDQMAAQRILELALAGGHRPDVQ